MSETVTINFSMDKDIYNQYKSIVVRDGENVKGNIVRYMKSVIQYETPNAETIAAIKEVEEMKKNPSLHKGYTDVDEMMRDLLL